MIRINLLPVREERRKAGARQLALVLVAALMGSVLLAAALHWKVRRDISSTREQTVSTQKEIDNFAPQLKQVEEFKKTKAEIEQKLDVIQGLNEARSGPVHMLDELASHTPDRIWITKIEVHGGRLVMEGMSLDNELVALLMTSLGSSPYFTNIELKETKAKDVDGLRLNEFTVTAAIVTPGGPDTAPAAVPDGGPKKRGAAAATGR